MLEESNFLWRLMIDFIKAFDTVDHTVYSSLVGYNLSPPIINWVYFCDL